MTSDILSMQTQKEKIELLNLYNLYVKLQTQCHSSGPRQKKMLLKQIEYMRSTLLENMQSIYQLLSHSVSE